MVKGRTKNKAMSHDVTYRFPKHALPASSEVYSIVARIRAATAIIPKRMLNTNCAKNNLLIPPARKKIKGNIKAM